MTITNGERREVARRLYEHGLFASLLPLDKYLAWMYDVLYCGRSVTSLTMRLADLIEPEPERTCRMRDAHWDDGQCTWGCICSECGAKHEHESGKWMNYCPNCGAKVVKE